MIMTTSAVIMMVVYLAIVGEAWPWELGLCLLTMMKLQEILAHLRSNLAARLMFYCFLLARHLLVGGAPTWFGNGSM